MALGPNRSPHQIFPRSDFEPDFSDKDLLPKLEVARPSHERQPFDSSGRLKVDGPGPFPADFLTATDLKGLPWIRRRGDEWTDVAFRTIVKAWLVSFFAKNKDKNLAGWEIHERATAVRSSPYRLPEDQQYLLVKIKRLVGEVETVLEVSITFPVSSRVSPYAQSRLSVLEASLDAQL